MKYLLTFIALLMMQSVYTQITKDQQNDRILDIFTPEYVIKSSKAISIMREQDSVLKVRDIQIKGYKNKITSLEEEYKKTLLNIISEKNIIQTKIKEVKEIKIKGNYKNNTSGYIGIEIPEFNFKSPNINLRFVYNIDNMNLGIKGELNNNISSKLTYQYYITLDYKMW